MPAYRLIGVQATTAAPARRRTRRSSAASTSWTCSSGAFAEAVGSAAARLVTVIGDAGVGKTRLIARLHPAQGPSEATVLRGRCLAYGDGITFWPLAEIVRAAAEIARGRPAARPPGRRSRPARG